MISGQPDLDAVKAWLDVDDTTDDVVLQRALDAALIAIDRAVCYPLDAFGDCVFDATLEYATYLLTQRWAARRNSPEGVVGLTGTGGDFVGARVPAIDVDVLQLLGPYLKIPVA